MITFQGFDEHRFTCGCANQSTEAAIPRIPESIDAALVMRKGRLYLLCAQEVQPTALAELCQSYYGNPSYDIIPTLRQALRSVHAHHAELRQGLPVALVIQGMELFVVATEQGVIWLRHLDEIREVFCPMKGRKKYQSWTLNDGDGPPFYGGRWRLSAGDTVIITTQEANQKLGAQQLGRILRTRSAAQAAAHAIARAARKSRRHSVPVSVISVAGFAPVPEPGAASVPTIAPPRPQKERSAGRRSPIWVALLIGMLAVALALWLKKPVQSSQNLYDLLKSALLPTPTAISLSGTPAPQESYTPPELLAPRALEEVKASEITLRWRWTGQLGENEYFEVRLGPLGDKRRSIGWTKELELTVHLAEMGGQLGEARDYTWTVVVVRGRGGRIDRELSPASPAERFVWQPE